MRYLSMAALIFVGTMMTGCSSDSEEFINSNQPELPADNVVTLTTTISRDYENSTRALTEGGVKTFEAGDEVGVVYQQTDDSYEKEVVTLAAGDITNEGKSARITVTLTDPKPDGIVKYVYPAAMSATDGTLMSYKLSEEQDGTFSKLAREFDFAKFEGNFNGLELPKGTLKNQLAICKFTIMYTKGTVPFVYSSLTQIKWRDDTLL